MLKAGTRAPDFEAVQHDGEKFCFSDWRGDSPVVIYFLPEETLLPAETVKLVASVTHMRP